MPETFEAWIGRSITRRDVVTARLLAEYRATLSGYLFDDGSAAPPGFHFGLAPAIPAPSELGTDGAEAKGLFLPPIPFARRMWAGGQIETLAPIQEGMAITRRSTVADIGHRDGKSGALYLVSIVHEVEAEGQLAVRERQDLVFRDAGRAGTGSTDDGQGAALTWRVDATAALLFRFSAFTFNGHRIHYDLDFARHEEGYGGLLVHGPLQAALLFNQLSAVLGQVPKVFSYRCLAPLVAGPAFHVHSSTLGTARIVDHNGIRTCEGRVPETA